MFKLLNQLIFKPFKTKEAEEGKLFDEPIAEVSVETTTKPKAKKKAGRKKKAVKA